MQAQEAVDLEPWAGGQVGPDRKLSAKMWYDKHDYYVHIMFLISLDWECRIGSSADFQVRFQFYYGTSKSYVGSTIVCMNFFIV